MTSQTLSKADLQSRCDFAIVLARRAGTAAARFFDQSDDFDLGVRSKGPQDFVTAADKETEDFIRSELSEAFPDDGFLGEESGGVTNSFSTWVVDPIDGTANYMRGMTYWGVSLAFVHNDEVVLGIVYDATCDRVYWAQRGAGAFRDSERIFANTRSELSSSLAILGYGRETALEEHIDLIRLVHATGMGFRNNGAAAIDILRVAEGSADVCYVHVLRCWDALAGLLIACEAGSCGFCIELSEFLKSPGPVLCGSIETTEAVLHGPRVLTKGLTPFLLQE